MSDLLAWCFHSPRRLLLVLVGLLALVVAVGAGVRALTPASAPSDAARPPGPTTVAATGPAVDAAVAFTRAWASKPPSASVQDWQRALEPLVTPELGRLLATTDPAALPGGGPQGEPGVRFLAAGSALVEVPLSTGGGVLVTVVLVNGRWLAGDVQPSSLGNAGDVGPGNAGGSPVASAGG